MYGLFFTSRKDLETFEFSRPLDKKISKWGGISKDLICTVQHASKGQLIQRSFFGSFDSSKKRTKKIDLTTTL